MIMRHETPARQPACCTVVLFASLLEHGWTPDIDAWHRGRKYLIENNIQTISKPEDEQKRKNTFKNRWFHFFNLPCNESEPWL